MDKVQKIKEWVSYKQDSLMDEDGYFEYPEDRGAYNVLSELDDYINSLQEEPVSKQKPSNVKRTVKNWKEESVNKDFEMALAEMIDKAQKCVVEPLVVAEQWKDELIKLAKSEEPVSEIDFEQELYKAFGQIKDFTLGIAIAKRFYDMGRKHNEPVSEDLEEEIDRAHRIFYDEVGWDSDEGARAYVADWFAHYFANWQKTQMIKNATEVTVHIDAGGYPYIPQLELYDYDKDAPLAKEGDRYKVVLIKKD